MKYCNISSSIILLGVIQTEHTNKGVRSSFIQFDLCTNYCCRKTGKNFRRFTLFMLKNKMKKNMGPKESDAM